MSKSTGILYKCRPFLNKRTLKDLYTTFVIPYFIYGIKLSGLTKET